MAPLPDTIADRLDAADHRCECTGQCRRLHRKSTNGRCHITGSTTHPLVLAPADPMTAWADAARLTPAELTAWCSACLTATERAARRQQADTRAADQPGLFSDTEAAA